MTHARHFPAALMLVGHAAAVLDDAPFVAFVSPARSGTLSTAAYFSIATIAELLPGTPGCNTASSDASAETSSRTPSINTPAFAAVAIPLFSVGYPLGIDFFADLSNLL